jgi:hypothetical protein
MIGKKVKLTCGIIGKKPPVLEDRSDVLVRLDQSDLKRLKSIGMTEEAALAYIASEMPGCPLHACPLLKGDIVEVVGVFQTESGNNMLLVKDIQGYYGKTFQHDTEDV